ncbi:hypothetical protein JW835_05685 [bacterium]|nr:hypothetical protein [bacterium]
MIRKFPLYQLKTAGMQNGPVFNIIRYMSSCRTFLG